MRMTMFRQWGGVVLCVVLLGGCLPEQEQKERWINLGQVPAARNTAASNHQPLAVSGTRVLVGTNDGVWARPMSEGNWTRTGLNGMKVQEVLAHPAQSGVVFAAGEYAPGVVKVPFAHSVDGGTTWTDAASSVFDFNENRYFAFYDIEVRPGQPDQIYANMSGNVINVSTDGGWNWQLQNGHSEPGFGYPCVLHIPILDPARVYQGCEAPLDVAWVGRQTISSTNPADLSNFTYVVYQDSNGELLIENRRPNALASLPTAPLYLYAGIEGGLIKVTGIGQLKWILRQTQQSSEYAYISAIWVNPVNPRHIIFGGFDKGPLPADFTLYETLDEGATIRRIRAPRTFIFPWVEQIVDTGEDLLVLISDDVDMNGTTPDVLHVYRLSY